MFKQTFFAIALTVSALALGCNQDMRKHIPGTYLATIADYESTCNPDYSGPEESLVIVQIDAVTETTFNFTFATDGEPLFMPEVAVDEDGNFSASYPWMVPEIYNELLFEFTGNVTPDTLMATLTLYILPVPGNGTEPVCYVSITFSGARCEEACAEAN